ncbi:hypothetical protein, conserved [Thermococcus kodakarensis KOD1]|uniref:Uncharacterized protein n=1 Tax=Thermococcus kodakarensis (strain ATCC BAA-918 / JCM 12380 / KOD1) TaxID=69014 RepID=Q5JDJ3_THEKO|nr:hypothetical protein [Thermococcus kodakarensis]WCN27411.1 hypothetical protein POG15_07325 [Thermococcus kodakarensis]WCN29701.1 hypothetical protein POG21_07320 [Thermococcus kodakarensis]BAD85629.1 hypothetical protein, conserved [Thermococcus kodakarensis KOD1]
MGVEELYQIAKGEFAEDLIFELDGNPITVSIKGLLLARVKSSTYNFSFFEVTETESVLAVQMKDFVVYIAFETDEELSDEEFAEIGKALLEYLTPKIALLTTKAEKFYGGKADILLDDGMSSDLREFMYSLLLKHRKGESPYEQTEVA